MVATEPASGELPGTASCDRIGWQWLPAYPGEDRSGVLGILLTHDRRKGPRTEFFWYAVTELETEGAGAGRKFALVREREPGKDAVVCVVGGMVETCGCEAGEFDKKRRFPTGCKHRRVLSDMVAKGAL